MMFRKFLVGIACILSISAVASAQQDGVRGGWLKSRADISQNRVVRKNDVSTKQTKSPQNSTPSDVTSNLGQKTLGIGYTLFMANAAGEMVRVGTDRQFKTGDRIALQVETNRRGYIYIFSQENEGPPRLLFPNSRIRNGNYLIEAHQTFWVPEEGEIEFDNRPAREKLTVVFSEEPLKNIPASTKPEGEAVEVTIFREVTRETTIRKGGLLDEGMLLTKGERQRGVRLSTKDPAPSFILVNQNLAEKRIVANIQLTHR